MGRLNRKNINRGISYLKRNGLKNSFYKATERLLRDKDEENYTKMVLDNRVTEEELLEQKSYKFERPYKISILVPLYETDIKLLIETIESVAKQSYGNWELCLADASSDDSRRIPIREFTLENNLKYSDHYGRLHDKVKYRYLGANKGISGNTNEALSMASGDYIALLDHDDVIEANTLFEYMKGIEKLETLYIEGEEKLSRIKVVYCDEDKVSHNNACYFDYHKKPEFDPYLLCTNNYICHFLMVDTSLAKGVEGFHSEYDGAQDHDFVLRCVEGLDRKAILHIDKPLYHWRSTSSSTAENPEAKLYAYEAGRRAVEAHLRRIGVRGKVNNTIHLGFFDVEYGKSNEEALVMTKDELSQITLSDLTSYKESFILVLSDKMKPITSGYEAIMLSDMENDTVGAVTGRIIGKNGRIESAGYDKILGGTFAPRFNGLNKNYSGYLHRAKIQQMVDGYSDDFVLIRKDAIKCVSPSIELKSGYDVFFEPKVEIKRK